MMPETDVRPTRAELVQRAADIAQIAQAHARWNEEHRRIHDDIIKAMAQAGMFKMRVPRRYGGYESDTRTLVEVLAALGQGDGSSAWVAWVLAANQWLVGLFPDEVQDEVFSIPDVRVSGTLSPTGTAECRDGGIVLNGEWHFHSGSLHSQWSVLAAMSATSGGQMEPIVALVPMSELHHEDDWDTAGLRGTGSVTTAAHHVFVPQRRVLPVVSLLQGHCASKLNAEAPIFRSPMIPSIAAAASGTPLGLAKAAMTAFLQRLPGRRITYTNYTVQAEAPITHLQVTEAALKIDEAEFHAYRAADLVDAKTMSQEAWTVEERCRVRLDTAQVARLAKEAIDILGTASGGSSIYSTVPIQRIARDIQAVNLQGMIHPNTNLELYGRILCGLEPNTFNI